MRCRPTPRESRGSSQGSDPGSIPGAVLGTSQWRGSKPTHHGGSGTVAPARRSAQTTAPKSDDYLLPATLATSAI
ncbi:hypothetical protein ANO14919_023220 [Xylariales sp. No.14919]|nr:hypothetical protein ANO14919_023220 [Xylariales sp. No.14919]